jgi:fructan beta-fructosidase
MMRFSLISVVLMAVILAGCNEKTKVESPSATEAVATETEPVIESPIVKKEVKADVIPSPDEVYEVYRERFRPQFHFSMKKGWINDPDGLVYHDGVYHLFCQHRPDSTRWGTMHWSHAVSRDLVNWEEQPIALYPDKAGAIWSGSAVVDHQNTSGLGTEKNPPILAFYTTRVYTPGEKPAFQSLAYSLDNGKTLVKYKGNPILNHVEDKNRDPKVFRFNNRWIMVLYLSGDSFGLFGSSNAIDWKELSRFEVPGGRECPDLFELPVVGQKGKTKWVFLAGHGDFQKGACAQYVIGSFDGNSFTPESKPIPIEWGGWNYSTQTYSNTPDGRRIFVSWMSTLFDGSSVLPGNPFNGQYRVPWELTLVDTEFGLRLACQPVKEVETLRRARVRIEGASYEAGEHEIKGIDSRSMDIECELEPGSATSVSFMFEGVNGITYNAVENTLRVLDRTHAWPLEKDGRLKLRILFDVNCLEVFGPDGLKVMSSIYIPATLNQLDESKPKVSLQVDGGTCKVRELTVWEMRSTWKPRATASNPNP